MNRLTDLYSDEGAVAEKADVEGISVLLLFAATEAENLRHTHRLRCEEKSEPVLSSCTLYH